MSLKKNQLLKKLVHINTALLFVFGSLMSSGYLLFLQNLPASAAPATNLPILTQEGYIFENDDGANADSNSQQAQGNTPINGVKKGEKVNLRMQLSNSDAPLNSNVGLFYQKDGGFWTQVKHGAAANYGGSDCNDTGWSCDTIDDAMGHSRGMNAAIDPSTGLPWVIFEAIDGDFTVGRYVGKNGTGCRGGNDKWSCDEIDLTLGQGASIAIGPSGNAWASYGGGGEDLFVAEFVGSGGTGCGAGGSTAWTCTKIYAGNFNSTDITVDDAGKVWVTTLDEAAGDLIVAEFVGTGGSGCFSGTAWNCVVVDNDAGTTAKQQSVVTIILDDTNNPNIFYEDNSGANAELVHSEYVGTSGSGCTSSAWNCTDIALDSGGTKWIDAAVSPDGSIWVSYSQESTDVLVVANFVGSGGNCDTSKSGSDAWDCTDVDTSGTDTGEGTSISFDPGGQALITYLDATEQALRYTRYVGSGGGGCNDTAWDGCSIIFDDASTNGRYTATVFDATGKAWVFFTSPGSNDLQIAVKKTDQFITPATSSAISATDSLTESHVDMTTVTDSANRDDADCLVGGATWSNGVFSYNGLTNKSLADGSTTVQCTEITFGLSTASASDGNFRFALAFKDNTKNSQSFWRGVAQIDAYPEMSVQDEPGVRFSKGVTPIFTDCSGGNGEWGCDVITNNSQQGRYGAVIVDNDGVAWTSTWNDAGDGWFVVAKYVGSGGNCDTLYSGSDRWQCEVVYDEVLGSSDDGVFSSVAINPLTNKPSFAFTASLNGSNAKIVVADYVGTGGTGCTGGSSAYNCTIIMNPGYLGFGEGTDIEFSPSGVPSVLIRESSGGDFWFARFVGQGGNCDDDYSGSDAWTCEQIITTGQVGENGHLVYDRDGIPWIASGNNDAVDDLFIAKYVGSGGSNCGNTAWNCWLVEDNVTVSAANETEISITVDKNNVIWAAYQDKSVADKTLKVAQYVGSGGTGCVSAAWTCTLVDSVTGDSIGDKITMGTDKSGYPVILYGNSGVPTVFNDVRYARYVGSGGTGCDSSAWDGCEVIYGKNGIGRDINMTFDGNGLVWAVSREETLDNLTLMKQHIPQDILYNYNTNVSQNSRVANATDLIYAITDGRSARTLENGACGSGLSNLLGYCGMLENDGSFDSISAAANERPYVTAAVGFSTNTEMPIVNWVGRSDVAPNTASTAGDLHLEIYRFGTTNAWEALATDSASSNCNTVDCKLSGVATGPPSEYFRIEDGVYWFDIRIYQKQHTTSMTLKTDELSATITGLRLRNGRTFEGGASRPFVTE